MAADEMTQTPPAKHARFGKRQRAALILLLGLALVAAWWASQQLAPPANYLAVSGTVEADEAVLSSEVAGQILAFAVDEGQPVTRGQVLATVDTALLEAQIRQAEAAVAVARANLALVEAGTRQEELRQLEAAVAQAQAARDGARKAWENAKAVLDDPQELDAKIATARPQVAAAEARLERLRKGATDAEREAARAAVALAQARLDELLKGATPEQLEIAERQLKIAKNQEYLAQETREELSRRTDDGETMSLMAPLYSSEMGRAQLGVAYEQTKLAEAQLAALKAAPTAERIAQLQAAVDQAAAQLRKIEQGPTPEELRVAEAEVAAAQANLDGLLRIRANPQAARAQVDAAWAQLQMAEAALSAAEARLAAARNGATAEQLAAARAQVRQAEAALDILQVQLAKSSIRAPMDGVVLNRLASPGESVVPGSRLLSLANLDEVFLTVYVPETQIGHIVLGQEVEVSVDSFPGERFSGKVVHVAERAEYTPRNVQSPRERANTVFAVKVALANPERTLKPGMPADATIRW